MLEEELSHICTWASLLKGTVAVSGDLNLDRLKPYQSEGKLLSDLEAEQGLEFLITEPTRTARKRYRLIDLISSRSVASMMRL